MRDDPILREQIAYYRARAEEYDRTTGGNAPPAGWRAAVLDLLGKCEPCEHVLELACGTGVWTQALATIGREVTAVDAAPEMLRIAERRVASANVHFHQADLFTWEPERQYDLEFLAFWLSHVPPSNLESFLDKASRAVRPGGQIIIVDQHAPTDEDRLCAKDDLYATRPLSDGRRFTIVKVFHELRSLEDRLTRLGFGVSIHKLDATFFLLVGRQNPRSFYLGDC